MAFSTLYTYRQDALQVQRIVPEFLLAHYGDSSMKCIGLLACAIAGFCLSAGAGAQDQNQAKITVAAKPSTPIVMNGKPFYVVLNVEVAAGFHIGGSDVGKNQIPT